MRCTRRWPTASGRTAARYRPSAGEAETRAGAGGGPGRTQRQRPPRPVHGRGRAQRPCPAAPRAGHRPLMCRGAASGPGQSGGTPRLGQPPRGPGGCALGAVRAGRVAEGRSGRVARPEHRGAPHSAHDAHAHAARPRQRNARPTARHPLPLPLQAGDLAGAEAHLLAAAALEPDSQAPCSSTCWAPDSTRRARRATGQTRPWRAARRRRGIARGGLRARPRGRGGERVCGPGPLPRRGARRRGGRGGRGPRRHRPAARPRRGAF